MTSLARRAEAGLGDNFVPGQVGRDLADRGAGGPGSGTVDGRGRGVTAAHNCGRVQRAHVGGGGAHVGRCSVPTLAGWCPRWRGGAVIGVAPSWDMQPAQTPIPFSSLSLNDNLAYYRQMRNQ